MNKSEIIFHINDQHSTFESPFHPQKISPSDLERPAEACLLTELKKRKNNPKKFTPSASQYLLARRLANYKSLLPR